MNDEIYFLTSDGELYHRRTWTRPSSSHKYTHKEWKNGRWVYYYDDGTASTKLPIGQNYKSKDTVKKEQEYKKQELLAYKAKETKEKERIAKVSKTIYDVAKKGEKFVDKLIAKGEKVKAFLNTPVYDTVRRAFERDRSV